MFSQKDVLKAKISVFQQLSTLMGQTAVPESAAIPLAKSAKTRVKSMP